MKQNEMFRKKGMLIIMMMLSCLNLCAYTYHFKCNYQGVSYNVNFTSRQAWACGLSSPITTTDVTIQSFTLTGSQIKEIYGNSGNFTIDGEAVDANATYSFETKEIANQAFKGSSVTSVSMDNSVTTIGSLAFQNCSSLQTVQLGNQVKTIEFEAFEGCRSLKNVQLSQSLETIGIQAFKYCSSLQTIHIPSKVQLIDSEAFMYCGLTSISFAEGCPLTKISYRSFSDCTQLVSIELPGKVENVGSESFYGCTNLQSIKFPSSLQKLENYSVFRCPNLTEVYCYAENVPSAGGYAFFMANNESFSDQTDPWTATLYVPATAIDAYKNAAVWETFGTVLPIPDGTTYLVTGITLNQNAYSLDVGNSFQLTATITPNYATNKGVTWSSSNTSVATVSTTGLVTAKSPGSATITCTAKDGSGVKATCSITVNNILVTNITLNSTSKSLDVGNTYQLTATVTPSNATNKGVTWSSSNTSVATVSTTGLVTAKSPGSATITCTAKDGSGVKATCAVTVKSTADAVTVRAQDYARYYGSDNPPFTYYVLSGTINSGEPVLSCSATKTSPVGPYEIIIERGTISNDSVKLVNGTLTVMKASLTISVGNYTKIEGEENPTFTPVFTGFRNGENNSVLTVQPTVSCEATKNSPAGTYTITVSGAEADNYNITYRSGTLTILPQSALDINETNFPDAAFREYVSGAAIDKDQNGRLSDEEVAAVKTINVNNQDIYDLKGIEFFTALTTLNCRFTKMTAIDVSQNTALTDLDCRNNNFTALDVTKNTALVSLECARNKITSLDVSKNTKLTMLRCNYNQLTALNVSKCTQLQRLDCFGNKIGKTAMDNLIASLPTTTNGRFYVIDTTLDSEENVCTTDQVAAAKAKGWTVYDYNNNSPVEYAGSTEQELGDLNGDNAVNGTDLVQQTNLILAGQYNAVADMNHDGVVNGTDYVLMVNKILGVSTAPRLLAPASASAGDATLSIEDFTISAGETKEMLIDMNNPSDEITLIQFDLRLPDGLSIATEGGEMLIDIAGRTTWRKHSLNANTLGDVTRFLLSSPTNAVISGTSGAVISITLTASDNFNGGTIQLENQLLVTPSADETKPADYSFTIEGNVPQGISIDEANFPDLTFREYVSGASIDKNQDRRLSDEELAEVTAIDVSNQAISSLKGVEFFTSLTTLKCGKNNLTMLDVSKNTAISYLYCDNNPLSSLDVTNNVALELLSCFNGQLTSLDVSKNAALKYLYCDDNSLKSLDVTKNAALSILSCDDCQLSSLDLSNNPALTALSCNKNLFTSLDVSKNTALTTLYCYINSLTALDVSNNTSLSELYCDNNQLTTLDLSKNTALTTFTCFNNMISESEMDQLVNSLPTVSNGKAYMICTKSPIEENVVNTEQVALAKSKGWTVFDYNGTSSEEYEGSATTGISGIDWDASGKNVPIHTLSGQRLTTPKKGINIIGGKKVVVK